MSPKFGTQSRQIVFTESVDFLWERTLDVWDPKRYIFKKLISLSRTRRLEEPGGVSMLFWAYRCICFPLPRDCFVDWRTGLIFYRIGGLWLQSGQELCLVLPTPWVFAIFIYNSWKNKSRLWIWRSLYSCLNTVNSSMLSFCFPFLCSMITK